MATLNHTNVAMLNKEMRNNDWRINTLERKINALNTKLNELIEEGIGGGESGGDNTGGNEQPPYGGDNTGGDTGSGIDVEFKRNADLDIYI